MTFKNIVIHTTPSRRRKLFDRSNDMPHTKLIIDGVSGTVLPGQFVALMGASGKISIFMIEIYLGAGKTTLLNYLSGRYLGKNLVSNGKVIINGVDSTKYQNGIS